MCICKKKQSKKKKKKPAKLHAAHYHVFFILCMLWSKCATMGLNAEKTFLKFLSSEDTGGAVTSPICFESNREEEK